jgi:PAS domain S-box-containing protein
MCAQEFLDALCNTGDGMFVVDANLRVVRLNSGAVRILGFSAAECLGRRFFQLVAGRSL